MRAKKMSEIELQINRCFLLARELGYGFNEYHSRIKKAIDNTCMQRYGYHAHSKELSRFLKLHPELC